MPGLRYYPNNGKPKEKNRESRMDTGSTKAFIKVMQFRSINGAQYYAHRFPVESRDRGVLVQCARQPR